jgi:RNA recognition motif-containing protein
MPYRLYIGNVPFAMTDKELGELFFGMGFTPSHPHILTFRENGKSRGFGFIELANQAEIDDAIRIMDGMNVGGRSIRVSMAIEKQPREDLQSADLRSADLRSADLRSADLRSADLRSADARVESSSQTRTPQTSTPQGLRPADRRPQDRRPQDCAPQDRTPQDRAPQARTPQARTPQARFSTNPPSYQDSSLPNSPNSDDSRRKSRRDHVEATDNRGSSPRGRMYHPQGQDYDDVW